MRAARRSCSRRCARWSRNWAPRPVYQETSVSYGRPYYGYRTHRYYGHRYSVRPGIRYGYAPRVYAPRVGYASRHCYAPRHSMRHHGGPVMHRHYGHRHHGHALRRYH